MRDHGGDLDRAMREFGAGDWLDLSTGINPVPYPVPELSDHVLTKLPTRTEIGALEAMAAQLYATQGSVVALGGAQAAIQLVPRLLQPGRARVVGPTYNEHTAALYSQGWDVSMVMDLAEGAGADLLTVVNPNNPDGRAWSPEALLKVRDKVGLLIVDESFADTEVGLSVAPTIEPDEDRVVVLRSFGKFFGLAGLRLGFAITGKKRADQLHAFAGPWAVSGPAIAVGCLALADARWQAETCDRLRTDAARLDFLAEQSGWDLVGGTPLFRTYDTPNARAVQTLLARHHIWSRIFPYSDTWIRFGLPGTEAGWARLANAITNT